VVCVGDFDRIVSREDRHVVTAELLPRLRAVRRVEEDSAAFWRSQERELAAGHRDDSPTAVQRKLTRLARGVSRELVSLRRHEWVGTPGARPVRHRTSKDEDKERTDNKGLTNSGHGFNLSGQRGNGGLAKMGGAMCRRLLHETNERDGSGHGRVSKRQRGEACAGRTGGARQRAGRRSRRARLVSGALGRRSARRAPV
jgi:hypothetical protein